MHRTEGTNHVNNEFTDGPPATCITDDWLNAVQEELAYVIEQAGLTMDTAGTETAQQLLEAFQAGTLELDISTLAIQDLDVYANNAAAIAGGLSAGDLYRTNADPDTVCVVH